MFDATFPQCVQLFHQRYGFVKHDRCPLSQTHVTRHLASASWAQSITSISSSHARLSSLCCRVKQSLNKVWTSNGSWWAKQLSCCASERTDLHNDQQILCEFHQVKFYERKRWCTCELHDGWWQGVSAARRRTTHARKATNYIAVGPKYYSLFLTYSSQDHSVLIGFTEEVSWWALGGVPQACASGHRRNGKLVLFVFP